MVVGTISPQTFQLQANRRSRSRNCDRSVYSPVANNEDVFAKAVPLARDVPQSSDQLASDGDTPMKVAKFERETTQMRSMCRARLNAFLVLVCAVGLSSAFAGTRPQVDLSVNVSVEPSQFVPGEISTVTMTVHNAGPDTAGNVLHGEPDIVVYEKPYDIVTRPPPFLIPDLSVGCTAYVEESEYIPGLPDGGITLMFTYWFEAIPAGQSRTCTYHVQFLSSTLDSFDTRWIVRTSNDDDINPENDRFDYTFVAAPPASPVSVPTGPTWGWLALGLGLLMIVRKTRQTLGKTRSKPLVTMR